MIIDPKEQSSTAMYQLLMSCVSPRPIAWVSSQDRSGRLNLAPFSFFNAVSSKPPLLSIAVARRQGQRKDTTNNASNTGEFVVNVVSEPWLDAMVASSAEVGPEVNEFELAKVTPAPCSLVKCPRVLEAPISLECRTREIFEISPAVTDLIIGEVIMVHVAEGLPIDTTTLAIPAEALHPVARLGRQDYGFLGTIRSVPRPT